MGSSHMLLRSALAHATCGEAGYTTSVGGGRYLLPRHGLPGGESVLYLPGVPSEPDEFEQSMLA